MDRLRPDGADGSYGSRRWLSYSDLEKRYDKTRVTLWRWVRAGVLPAPYQTGPNSVGFDAAEIEARDAALERCTYAAIEVPHG